MIDYTKGVSTLTASLIAASRKVMETKEADRKADNKKKADLQERKTDPVGREDADIDNDGMVTKSDRYLAKRRIAILHAVTNDESVDVDDDGDQIDELSKGTLGSYAKLAMVDRHTQMDAGKSLAKYAEDDHLRGQPEGAKHFGQMAAKKFNKAYNRTSGAIKAIDKLSKEGYEVTILDDEFGIGTILGEQDSTVEVMFDHGIEQLNSTDIVVEEVESIDEVSMDTLQSYIRKAKVDPAFDKKKGNPSKATVAIRNKRLSGTDIAKEKLTSLYDKQHQEENKVHSDNVHHVRANVGKALGEHGYKLAVTHAKRDVYTKPNTQTGHVMMATVHHPYSNKNQEHVLSMTNSSGWLSSDNRHYVEKYPRDEHGNRDYGAKRKATKDDVMKALHSHIAGHEAGMNSRPDYHYESTEDTSELIEAKSTTSNFASAFVRRLEEAKRGRPRKVPLAPAKDGEDEDDGVEANQHIINQLRKAQISMTGSHKVTFQDNTTHPVSGQHASKLLDKYSALKKPSEKEELQKRLGASHKSMMNEV